MREKKIFRIIKQSANFSNLNKFAQNCNKWSRFEMDYFRWFWNRISIQLFFNVDYEWKIDGSVSLLQKFSIFTYESFLEINSKIMLSCTWNYIYFFVDTLAIFRRGETYFIITRDPKLIPLLLTTRRAIIDGRVSDLF